MYDNTRRNAEKARLLEGGQRLRRGLWRHSFPIPQSGVEAVWNHVARYRGTYAVRQSSDASVQRNGSYALITTSRKRCSATTAKGGSAEQLDNMSFHHMAVTKAPARSTAVRWGPPT